MKPMFYYLGAYQRAVAKISGVKFSMSVRRWW